MLICIGFIIFSVDTEQMFITDLVRNRLHRILNYSLGITLSINIEKLFWYWKELFSLTPFIWHVI